MTCRYASFWTILWLWGWSTAAVLIAIIVGPELRPSRELESIRIHPYGPWEQFSAFDGGYYYRIAASGYVWNRDDWSAVVFFPAYPMAAHLITVSTRIPVIVSLMLVSNLSCLLSAWIWNRYVYRRVTFEGDRLAVIATIWLLLSPMSIFFRACYSESLFVLVLAMWLYGTQRCWSLWLLAIISGVATATRPVGIVLLPVFVWHLWQTSKDGREFLRSLVWAPVAVWGLLVYMVYLGFAHGDPLRFAHGQSEWVLKPLSFPAKLVELLTLEPIWGCYLPQSHHYWATLRPGNTLWNSLDFWNPLYFVASGGLLALGTMRGWLCRREQLLGWLLLLFPYVMIGAENSMQSQARFTVVNLPLYLVLANVTVRQPTWLRLIVFGGVGGTLVWTAMLFGTSASIF